MVDVEGGRQVSTAATTGPLSPGQTRPLGTLPPEAADTKAPVPQIWRRRGCVVALHRAAETNIEE